MSWSNVSTEKLFDGNYTHVENWRMSNHKGEDADFEILKYPDAVFIFGLTEDEKVLMLDQYSVAAQDRINHLVAGYVDEGEKPVQAAERELKEETGYTTDDIQKLGSTNRSKWATGNFHFFLGLDVEKTSQQRLDNSEDIEVSLVSVSEFKELLEDSQLHAAGSVACAYKALNYLGELA